MKVQIWFGACQRFMRQCLEEKEYFQDEHMFHSHSFAWKLQKPRNWSDTYIFRDYCSVYFIQQVSQKQDYSRDVYKTVDFSKQFLAVAMFDNVCFHMNLKVSTFDFFYKVTFVVRSKCRDADAFCSKNKEHVNISAVKMRIFFTGFRFEFE